ncbi:hypothetical protein BJ878DRAFT_503798 [Calycina marina]|uniref:Secreted protein n=1 Tax=Calycina marina TaxID=1763456 RepID=A0A9P8CF92_9HELO|nr:hypothetical protein BJ878DRAFT_503798 [Calycina marina]
MSLSSLLSLLACLGALARSVLRKEKREVDVISALARRKIDTIRPLVISSLFPTAAQEMKSTLRMIHRILLQHWSPRMKQKRRKSLRTSLTG